MPNLEQYAVTDWLAELRAGSDATDWPPPIRPIEVNGALPSDLAGLGEALDELVDENIPKLGRALRGVTLRSDLQAVMAQLGAARTARLLHWMAEVDVPDCHEIIASLMRDDSGSARALRASISAVTRTGIVRRMFAPDRVAALEAACNSNIVLEET